METNNKSKLPYFLIGVGVAAVTALLFALRAGEDTRKYLRERGSQGLDTLNQQGRKLRDTAKKIVQKGTGTLRGHSTPPDTPSEAEREAYEQQKRDNLGG
jgi:gas vesicle protein